MCKTSNLFENANMPMPEKSASKCHFWVWHLLWEPLIQPYRLGYV